MTKKLAEPSFIPSYHLVRFLMQKDLEYRLEYRKKRTSFGRPLYQRINVQVLVTKECPFSCPFCIERKNPMSGANDFDKQLVSLPTVLKEHSDARLTITGGEPGLYPEHVERLVNLYRKNSNNVFLSINTAGYNSELNGLGHINLSVNKYVKPDVSKFKGCTYQTVLDDDDMTIDNIRNVMDSVHGVGGFSFRFMSHIYKHDYPVYVFNEAKSDKDIRINTFRVGDFFVYLTFTYRGKHGRITLGDMHQQMTNDYQDGYSNIIIHPDGRIGLNWT